MEETLFKTFCMQQRLRSLGSAVVDLPPALSQLLPSFEAAFGKVIRGTLLRDAVAFMEPKSATYQQKAETKLDSETMKLLSNISDPSAPRLRAKGVIRRSVTYLGIEYKPTNVSLPDSCVIIKSQSPGQSAYPARITQIFDYLRKDAEGSIPQTYLRISKFKPLSTADSAEDVYANIPYAGQIYGAEVDEDSCLITTGDIACHFAMTRNVCKRIKAPHIHVLPLEKVCHAPSFFKSYHPCQTITGRICT